VIDGNTRTAMAFSFSALAAGTFPTNLLSADFDVLLRVALLSAKAGAERAADTATANVTRSELKEAMRMITPG
jgi:hypothetical protein